MTTAPQTPTVELLPLNAILESAVFLNWAAFGQPSGGGMVQIEYHAGSEKSIEYLNIWSATTRGYWSLVCDYAIALHRPNGTGARFSNGFHSRDLGRYLDSILMNQTRFSHDCQPNSNVVIQVRPPSEEQTAQARERIGDALRLVSPPPRVPRVPKAPATHAADPHPANA